MKLYTLLLIDDDLNYCTLMQAEARQEGFELLHRQSLEEGMELLVETPAIQALILDTRCPVDDDDTSKARSNFILHAISRLHDFEHDMNQTLPFCICTENPDEFAEDMEGMALVFDKKAPKSPLFAHIRQLISMLPRIRIRDEYSELFDVFSHFFSYEEEELLTDLVMNAGKDDSVSVISNLILLRRLEESLISLAGIKLIRETKKNVLPQQTGQARQTLRSLNELRFLDNYHYRFADEMYKLCSKYGNHILKPHEQKTVLPTSLTVRGLIYIFADISVTLSRKF